VRVETMGRSLAIAGPAADTACSGITRRRDKAPEAAAQPSGANGSGASGASPAGNPMNRFQ
jgi:hypothetical protein